MVILQEFMTNNDHMNIIRIALECSSVPLWLQGFSSQLNIWNKQFNPVKYILTIKMETRMIYHRARLGSGCLVYARYSFDNVK